MSPGLATPSAVYCCRLDSMECWEFLCGSRGLGASADIMSLFHIYFETLARLSRWCERRLRCRPEAVLKQAFDTGVTHQHIAASTRTSNLAERSALGDMAYRAALLAASHWVPCSTRSNCFALVSRWRAAARLAAGAALSAMPSELRPHSPLWRALLHLTGSLVARVSKTLCAAEQVVWRAAALLAVGAALCAVISDPMVEAVSSFSKVGAPPPPRATSPRQAA